MKRLIITVAATLLVAAPAATAAPTPGQLQTQINALKREVTALKAKDAKLEDAIAFVNDKDTCTTTIMWDVTRIIGDYVGMEDPGALDDGGACDRIGVNTSYAVYTQTADPLTKLKTEMLGTRTCDWAQLGLLCTGESVSTSITRRPAK
jgi:hypothetical protein